MSKSVLVIDTPKRCGECKFHNNTSYSTFKCGATFKYGDNKDNFPTWCPLTPLPEYNDLSSIIKEYNGVDMLLRYQYEQGYNDCLYDIQKGEINK